MRCPPISANEPPDRPLAGIAPDRLAHRQGRRPAGPRGMCCALAVTTNARNTTPAAAAPAAGDYRACGSAIAQWLPGPARPRHCRRDQRRPRYAAARTGPAAVSCAFTGTAGPQHPRVSPRVRSHLVPARGPREPDDPPQFGLPSRWPGRRRQTWLPTASVSLLFAVRRSSQSIGPRTSSFSSLRSTSSRMAPTTAWASSIVRFTVITAPTSSRSSTAKVGCTDASQQVLTHSGATT